MFERLCLHHLYLSDVRAVLQRYPGKKALGPDLWHPHLLAALLDSILVYLLAWLRSCMSMAVCLIGLLFSCMSQLPKPESVEFRTIARASMLWRVWVASRRTLVVKPWESEVCAD